MSTHTYSSVSSLAANIPRLIRHPQAQSLLKNKSFNTTRAQRSRMALLGVGGVGEEVHFNVEQQTAG